MLTHGAWPEPVARHTCDNPLCCNPAHILAGTHADNAHDRTERGRQRGNERINEKDVQIIRVLRSIGLNNREIGKRYGIGLEAVSRIYLRKTWAHVPDLDLEVYQGAGCS